MSINRNKTSVLFRELLEVGEKMTKQELETIKNNVFVDYHEELEDEVIAACEKQVAKKITKKITYPGCYDNEGVWHTWNGIDGIPYDLCPSCETNLCTDGVFGRDKKRMKYCENCGQKLDWT